MSDGIDFQPFDQSPQSSDGIDFQPMEQPQAPPQSSFQKYGSYLPMAGGIAGAIAGGTVTAPAGGTGALPGAMLGGAAGESARQLIARYLGQPVPQTPIEAASQIGKQGIIQGAGEAVGEVAAPLVQLAKPVVGSAAQGLSKVAGAFTGGKSDEFLQAARQGYSTYLAPSMQTARDKFGQALEQVGISPKGPVEARYDPQLTVARQTATDVATKLEKGQAITAEEAFHGRQAIDRVITATSSKDKNALAAMYDDKDKLDAILSNQAGPLKDASEMYRGAIVKRGVTQPLRVVKSGAMGQTIPILSAALGSAVGMRGGVEEGAGTAALGMAGTSPAMWGLGATTLGQIAKTGANPLLLQALISKYLQNSTSQGGSPTR